jgi:hypothetical protein
LREHAAYAVIQGEGFMKKETVKYTSDKGEIIGALRPIKDFLPAPADLFAVIRKTGPQTKVTLELDNEVVAFFKREARRRRTSYQRMIRNLVRSYAQARSTR